MGLKRFARSLGASDSADAYDLVKAIAISAAHTDAMAMVQDWGHADASYCPWASETRKGAIAYKDEKLLVAASGGAAEFEAPRSYSLGLMEDHIFKILIAATERVTGY